MATGFSHIAAAHGTGNWARCEKPCRCWYLQRRSLLTLLITVSSPRARAVGTSHKVQEPRVLVEQRRRDGPSGLSHPVRTGGTFGL